MSTEEKLARIIQCRLCFGGMLTEIALCLLQIKKMKMVFGKAV
jgi:hypothetical protein